MRCFSPGTWSRRDSTGERAGIAVGGGAPGRRARHPGGVQSPQRPRPGGRRPDGPRSTPLVDLHCHLIPGVDDGPATLEDALALARAMAAQGIAVAAATSHVDARHPNTAASLGGGRGALVGALAREGIALEVVAGAEIEASLSTTLCDEELAGLTLGGGPWLVIETPQFAYPTGLDGTIATLRARGFEVVLAHPERSEHVRREPRLLEGAVRAGALAQINADSLVGDRGRARTGAAWRFIESGLGHLLASDAHSVGGRRPLLAQARRAVAERVGEEAAESLTRGVPRGILAGVDADVLTDMCNSTIPRRSFGRRLTRRVRGR